MLEEQNKKHIINNNDALTLHTRTKNFNKGRRRQAISINPAQPVTMKPLNSDQLLPMLIEPAYEQVELMHWLCNNKSEWQELWLKHGAILFRGFNIDTVEKMEQFSQATIDNIYKDNTEHQPVNASGSVQVPVDYANDQHLLWHNENTFNQSWPTKAIFACAQPAAEGGETPLVDGRKIFEQLDPDIRERFLNKGVMYVRSYGTNDFVGLSWKKVFNTQDKAVVEEICRQRNIEFKWKKNDHLITRAIRPAVLQHPQTKQWSWINQAQHWHFSCLPQQTQDAISTLYCEEDYPRNCYFGDGSKIDDEIMQNILDLYRKNEVVFTWQKGDVALVDNRTIAHARNAYQGERKILVCFGDLMSF
jgi:alpha-ketoglutarate-dependent taurine dioxygenase